MNLSTDAWQFIGAITVAMIAGLVSFIVTILAKEQKTSEFRQSWIDALRQELSDFAAILLSISDTVHLKSERGDSEDRKSLRRCTPSVSPTSSNSKGCASAFFYV